MAGNDRNGKMNNETENGRERSMGGSQGTREEARNASSTDRSSNSGDDASRHGTSGSGSGEPGKPSQSGHSGQDRNKSGSR